MFEFVVKMKIRLANKNCKPIKSVTLAKNGFYYVQFDNYLYNYANNKTYKLLTNEYYNEMSDFHDGITLAYDEDKGVYKFIKEDGTVLNNQTYSYARRFVNGFAPVSLKCGNFNYIDTNGNLISNSKLTETHHFSCNRARVTYQSRETFIKPNGDFIGKDFLSARDFHEDRAIVYRNLGYIVIDLDGNFITNDSFAAISDYTDGVAIARGHGYFSEKILIDKNGKTIKELDE